MITKIVKGDKVCNTVDGIHSKIHKIHYFVFSWFRVPHKILFFSGWSCMHTDVKSLALGSVAKNLCDTYQ